MGHFMSQEVKNAAKFALYSAIMGTTLGYFERGSVKTQNDKSTGN
jgi:hypothetical protein